MLLQFTLLSVYSWNVVHSYFSYIVCCSLPLQAIDHCFALMQVSDWVSEWASRVQLLCVCFGWCSSLHYFYLLVHVFCCYLFVVLCLFVAAAASVFSIYWNVAHFVPFFLFNFKTQMEGRKNDCVAERNPLWLLVAYSRLLKLTRSWVRFFVLFIAIIITIRIIVICSVNFHC